MCAFLRGALIHFGRQLVFGAIEDLVDWIRDKLRGVLPLDEADHAAAILTTAEEVEADTLLLLLAPADA